MAADKLDILQACRDPQLFGPWFRDERTWAAWFAFLRALFGLPMSPEDLAIFQRHTGRTVPPARQVTEAWLPCGRRAGKSFIVALIAVFVAAFRDHTPHLAPGERGVVMVLAADRKQARVILRYVMAFLTNVPMLKRLVLSERAEGVELANMIDIEIHSSNFRAVRGYTVVSALCDEIAFWSSEDSANPDREIINALRPAMATIPGALLIGLSSPYARRGVLWEAFRDHFGKDRDDILVWVAATKEMNPSVPQSVIDRAYADDPTAAAAEYGAQFRSDVASFLLNEWLDVIPTHPELPPVAGTRYHAFADPSGGAADSFTLAIAHKDSDSAFVLDLLRGRRPPFDPGSVVAEFAAILKTYGIQKVMGDRYAAEWVTSAFRDQGITYENSEKPKSDLYLEAEPLFARGVLRLVEHRSLMTELRQLERRTGASGKDRVDHPPRGHDDYANSASGALVLAARQRALANLADAFVASREDTVSAMNDRLARMGYPIHF